MKTYVKSALCRSLSRRPRTASQRRTEWPIARSNRPGISDLAKRDLEVPGSPCSLLHRLRGRPWPRRRPDHAARHPGRSAASLFPRRHPAGTTQWQSRKSLLVPGRGPGFRLFFPLAGRLPRHRGRSSGVAPRTQTAWQSDHLLPGRTGLPQTLRRNRSNLQHSPCPRRFFTRFRQANPRSHWPDRSPSRDALDRHLFLGVGLSQET